MQLVLSALAALSFTVGGIFMKHANGLRNESAILLSSSCYSAVGAAIQSEAMRGSELGATYIVDPRPRGRPRPGLRLFPFCRTDHALSRQAQTC